MQESRCGASFADSSRGLLQKVLFHLSYRGLAVHSGRCRSFSTGSPMKAHKARAFSPGFFKIFFLQ